MAFDAAKNRLNMIFMDFTATTYIQMYSNQLGWLPGQASARSALYGEGLWIKHKNLEEKY